MDIRTADHSHSPGFREEPLFLAFPGMGSGGARPFAAVPGGGNAASSGSQLCTMRFLRRGSGRIADCGRARALTFSESGLYYH